MLIASYLSPNVVRYFYKETTESFLYIALELCLATLGDVVERPAEFRELGNLLDPKKALTQITNGLRHLHSLSSEYIYASVLAETCSLISPRH